MTVAPPSVEPPIVEPPKDAGRHLWWIIPLCALLAIAGAAFVAWYGKIDRTSGETGVRVIEELSTLRTDRIALQAPAHRQGPDKPVQALRPGGVAAGAVMRRYAPDFVAPSADDPPVQVEVVGLHFAFAGGQRPRLTLGDWRGEAEVAPGRLRFTVPRAAFAAASARTAWANATLSMQSGTRTLTSQLLFLVLPDRPGFVALDQKAREMTTESNTLASPEILARADGGETRTVRRCFDPPPGWRFDKENRRVVIVERLGWMDDVPDDTLNGGSVEFAGDEAAAQIS